MSSSVHPRIPIDDTQDTLSKFLESVPQQAKDKFSQSVEFIKQYAHKQDFLIEEKRINLEKAQEMTKILSEADVTTEQGVKDLLERFPKPQGHDDIVRPTFQVSKQMPSIDHLAEMVDYLKEQTRKLLKQEQDDVLESGWDNENLLSPFSRQSRVYDFLSMHEALSSWSNPHLVRNFFHSPSKINQAINVITSLMADPTSSYAKNSLGEEMSFKDMLVDIKNEEQEMAFKKEFHQVSKEELAEALDLVKKSRIKP